MTKKTITINGGNFSDMAGFYHEMNNLLMKNAGWKMGESLDALNDILYGGFGVYEPGEPIVVRWRSFSKSKMDLGFDETRKQYQSKVNQGLPYNVDLFQKKIEDIENGSGQTLCDIIIEIFREHKNIKLILED